jgi:EmrB/QacA subfamily drug resistance transporter
MFEKQFGAESNWPLLWLVAGGFFMLTLDATIVTTALPEMAYSLNESPLSMQSVIVAYVMTMALLIPASGWIADRFGTRKVYIVAIGLFTLGSFFCGLSQTLEQLIIARIIQGLGASLMLPTGRLALIRVFTGSRLLPAISFVTIPSLIGPLIGPALGGWLVEVASWHWIFLINLPMGVLWILGAWRYMPGDPVEGLGRFDIKGYLLLVVGMLCLALALDGSVSFGFSLSVLLSLILLSLASFVGYWRHALSHARPLFPSSLFLVSSLRIGLLGNFVARLGCSSVPYLLPLFFQVCHGYSPLNAGLLMLPIALTGICVKPLVNPLVTWLGYRRALVINTVFIGFTILSFALNNGQEQLWLQVIVLSLFGIFNSLQLTAMSTLTLKDLDEKKISSGNTALTLVQMLSMGLGISCASGLLAVFDQFSDIGDDGSLVAFRMTFISMGVLTLVSASIFWRLDRQ